MLDITGVICCKFVVHKCIPVFKTVHYLFTYLPTLFYAHFMSEALSKREQRKLQQTLKLFQASEVPQAKPKKKRKHNERGITLIANQRSQDHQHYAETKELSQFNSTPYRDTSEHKQEGYLNHKYFPEHEYTLPSFLNEYHYRQMEKSYQKQCQDYAALDHAGTALVVTPSPIPILQKIRPFLHDLRSSSSRRPLSTSRVWGCSV